MPAERRIRILIVDDSAVMRSLLRSVLATEPALEVAGTAADGASALASLPILRPDVVLLDVEMPVMDGLLTLRELRRRGHRMPVIMCSALTQRGASVTLEALASGASDYVAKPAGQSNREAAVKALSHDLVPKILALTQHLAPPRPVSVTPPHASSVARKPLPAVSALAPHRIQTAPPAVLVIGVSTGGPAALELLLPALPGDYPLPILIVQHMPELFTRLFAERLERCTRLRVHEAVQGAPVLPGTVTVARGNWHMELRAPALPAAPVTLNLTQGAVENHCRPAADVLFRSAVKLYGAGTTALVLTGMGSDGLAGCRLIREHGGTVIAQDQATSVVWGMPGAVVNAGVANKTLPLNEIAPELVRLTSRAHSEARELRESMV